MRGWSPSAAISNTTGASKTSRYQAVKRSRSVVRVATWLKPSVIAMGLLLSSAVPLLTSRSGRRSLAGQGLDPVAPVGCGRCSRSAASGGSAAPRPCAGWWPRPCSRPTDLIAPLFVREGISEPHPISSLPGVVQHTRASLRQEVKELIGLGVPSVILFGVPEHKDAEGTGASDPDGIVQVALARPARRVRRRRRAHRRPLPRRVHRPRPLRPAHPRRHGRQRRHARPLRRGGRRPGRGRRRHRGPLRDDGRPGGRHPRRPRRGRVRSTSPILAYAAKYASALYGPFREAVDVEIAGGGDRKAYQQDSGQRPRGARGGAGRRGRGRRPPHGEAGPGLPRRHRQGPGRARPPASRRTTCRASTP